MNGAALARCASNAAARSTWSGAMLHVPSTSRSTLRIARRIASRRRTWVRSEEHTSELQSLMRISYAVLCLKKKKYRTDQHKQLYYTDHTKAHIRTTITKNH